MAAVMSFEEAVARVTAPGERFELLEIELRGEKLRVFQGTPPSLAVLLAAGRMRADEIGIVYEDERWTYGDLVRCADDMAALLVERYGVEPGDRVAIAMRNYPEYLAAYFATVSIGAIAVCMNAWWTPDEMAYGIEDCGCKLLVGDLERLERAVGGMQAHGVPGLAIRAEGELPPDCEHWTEVRVEGRSMPEVEIDPDQDAMILYTSGTTGFPKGAVSSHRAVLSALMAFACRAAVSSLMYPPEDEHPYPTSFVLTVPLFHVTGLVAVTFSAWAAGAKLVMMYKWNPERALELIERERITNFVGVPTMSWDLLESADFERRDTSSLLSVGGGGAPAPPELVQRIEDNFKKGRPGIGYGMTETNAYGPQNSGDDYVRKPRSSGRCVPVMEIRVADEAGNEVPRGEVGEILFSGPNLIRGYWNKPEATAETFHGKWLRSGDIGRMDDEGLIYVEDRAKDMVLRAGENVYCAEVEAAIYEHPDVHEVAVFGVPHERLGEEVAASIVPKRGRTVDVEAIRAHVGERLAAFKVPAIVTLHEGALPRNAAGKILKRALRDEIVEARG